MSTTTIHPSTSTAPLGRHALDDPLKNINALRDALCGVDDLQVQLDAARVEIERREAMELGLRNALHARDERLAELGTRLVRAEEALADLAGQAWRLQAENERLSAQNRLLREPQDVPTQTNRARSARLLLASLARRVGAVRGA